MLHVESNIGPKEFTLGHESKIQESDALLMYAFLSHYMLLVLTQENTPPMFSETKLTLSLNFEFKVRYSQVGILDPDILRRGANVNPPLIGVQNQCMTTYKIIS